ncbi:MAG: hypothetical protein ACREP3_11235 [Candidatus Binatia bacterium]
MDLAKYIVKARPGFLGGKHEEKRPLRQLSAAGVPTRLQALVNGSIQVGILPAPARVAKVFDFAMQREVNRALGAK